MAKTPDYGQFIFAPNRKDTPKPPERDTPEEKAAWAAFQKHYCGGKDTYLNRLGYQVVAARDCGWHCDYLAVPKQYRRAYRIINDIPAAAARALVPSFPTDGRASGWASGGTYKPHKSRVNSWTVDTGILKKLLADFGGEFYRNNTGAYHIIFVADLNLRRNSFIMNPDVYTHTPRLAGEFSYQREIISVDSLPVVGVAYCRHDEFGGDDKRILRKLVETATAK